MWIRTFLVLAGLSNASGVGANPPPGWVEAGLGLPKQGQWRHGFDLADFNGDGHADLVHGPPRRSLGPPSIFLGGADLEFVRWEGLSFPELSFDYGDAAAADFDGDGHADFALGVHYRELVVLTGDGRGNFLQKANTLKAQPGATVFSSRALVAGDVDGDGRPDIVALGEGARPRGGSDAGAYGIRVLLNRLPELWDLRELHPPEGRLFGNDLTLGDFDGDGGVDLIAASSVQSQRGLVFWAEGGGGFAAGQLTAARPKSFVEALAAADFDGDGAHDLVLAFSDLQGSEEKNGLDLMISGVSRTWRRRELPWSSDSGRPTAVAVGDPDGDGDSDLVALTSTGAVVFFESDGGRLLPGPGLPSALGGRGCRGYHAQLADLDGDGRDELLAGFADESCEGEGSLRVWTWSAPAPRPSP